MIENNIDEFKKKYNQALERTLETIGLFIDGEAVIRCPVDTGNLRSSISHKTDIEDKSIQIGASAEYALEVEKGIFKKRPQPFIEPAVYHNIKKIEELAKRGMAI